MLFNSYEFIFIFLPLTFIGFFLLGHKGKKRMATLWLVLASFFFYGYWDVRYVPLLFGSICFNYWVGRHLEAKNHCKSWLIFGVLINVLLLGYFKYMDFFLETVNMLAGHSLFDLPHIVLPLGISFFTFTQTAYLVDAYRGESKNESFLTYLEFVTIFPHLIAGPIINHKEMIPQFIADKTFRIDYENIALGLTVFTFGLFKKVVIADMLAVYANAAFGHAMSLYCAEAWVGALSYTLQLYFDFSGYSEMAIGLALMFNLNMPVNFNSPYQACSIIDFWRRWHMTLGLWVKNYLYIPMGGNRNGELRKMRNLFVSMLIIGLWHGAGWTFVIWGGFHGALLMINHAWRKTAIVLPKAVSWGMTFLCVTLLWVIFRADNIHDAMAVLSSMGDFSSIAYMDEDTRKHLIVLISSVLVLTVIPNPLVMLRNFQPNYKWLGVTAVIMIFTLYKFSRISDFLYFQF
ncbi:D-alanyl-lipoteichoic acid acyltransferase DltB, MBOAT superfamily [Selenomonas sp. GACV-9]|uniref:MBOAT family O-acyltransferase n=1 Tax=Selenomonas sp. GACV-9 TaxID=3158782 RepID=UPI0008F39C82|nr:D-alanyl-lipoteichoic acid acyltransferase DltB, MBOAT superfamily [Selenomonas ruminantium]